MKFKLKVYNNDGTSSKEKEFSNIPVFEGDKGVEALRYAINAYMANNRQGNACTKTRAEVSGTGKKPWRQKGTGMARHGSKRSPLWPGGGVAFGPKPRDYSKKINLKVKKLALGRALFDLAVNSSLDLVEAFSAPEIKTKTFGAFIKRVKPTGPILIIDDAFEDNVVLSARNLPNVHIIDAASVNAWDIVRYRHVLISERGLNNLIERVNG